VVDEGLNSDVALTRVERQFETSGLLSSPSRYVLHDEEIFFGIKLDEDGVATGALLVLVLVED